MNNPEIERSVQDSSRGREGLGLHKVFLLAVVGLAIGTFYLSGLNRYLSWDSIHSSLDHLQAVSRDNYIQSVVFFFLIYVTVTALSLPVAGVLSLLAGALYGRWTGLILISLASTLGATLAFISGRYLFRDMVTGKFGKIAETINRGIKTDGVWYLLMLRLVPVIPFFMVNLGMALTSMPVSVFMLTSWAGMLVGTFLYVNAGTELGKLESLSGLISPSFMISIGLLGIIPLLIRWIIRLLKHD